MKKHSHSLTPRYCNMRWLAVVLIVCLSYINPSHAIAREPGAPVATLLADAPETLKVDAARFTEQSFNWFDSQRQRIVPAKLYLPANKATTGLVPLVVFSHGIGGSRDGYSYLGHYFAANGYGSLHVQHVGSDRQLWLGNPLALPVRLGKAAQSSEAIDRALDLRYALDELLGGNQGALFDTARIAVAGHSYGANTTMLIAGAQVELDGHKLSLRDPRINAAILISAPPFYRMGDASKILAGVDVPTLHITATEDVIQIPGYISGIQDRMDIFKAMGNGITSPKVLAVFKDGSHSIFTDRMGTGGLYLNPRVKIATRQLALAFLNGLPNSNFGAMDAWSLSNADLVARFEKRLP